jgi:hypothetical protein
VKNIQLTIGLNTITELFRLIEEEESPFVISKRGKEALADIMKINEKLSIY